MHLRDLIASQSFCACEPGRLSALLARVNEPMAAVGDFDSDLLDAVYPPLPDLQVDPVTGTAIIPVCGLILKGAPVFYQRYFGLCDIDRVSAFVDEAAANPAVRTVAFVFDSPGGYTTGVEELAGKVAALTAMPGKSTFGFTDTMSCSASEWIMSQCGANYATPSAIVGAIGTYATYIDDSQMMQNAGIQVRVFRSGAYKGIGEDAITPEQAAFLQASIERNGTRFRAAVAAARPQVQAEAMQGQWFSGQDAVAVGLLDAVVPDLTAAFRLRGIAL